VSRVRFESPDKSDRPIAQALVIASGLVLGVFGFLYMAWRSTAADRTASLLDAMSSALSASMLAGIGTFLLLVGKPNLLIRIGMGIWAYTSAFKRGFMAWHRSSGRPSSHPTFKAMFRFYSLGNLVAGGLAGIGCLSYGGAIGVVGASLSAYWVVMHSWLLNRLARENAKG
jgi:hypothetical protein